MRIALILTVALLVGCGSKEREAAAPPSTSLKVTVMPKGHGGPATTTTVTDAHGLHAKAFAPVPGTTACTEIYGGDATATVTGRLAGEPIDARFNLANGCEISRWEGAAAVLGDPPR